MPTVTTGTVATPAPKPPKVKIPHISKKEQYDDWKWQVFGEIKALELETVINNAADTEPDMTTLTDIEKVAYVALSREVRAALQGDAVRICAAARCEGAAQILHQLESAFGANQAFEHQSLLAAFHAEKFQSGDLKLWIAEKYGMLLKIPHIVPDGAPRNGLMMAMLLSSMPKSFDGVCSDLRANLPTNWQDVEKRLLDYKKSQDGPKRELTGTAYILQGEHQQGNEPVNKSEATASDKLVAQVKALQVQVTKMQKGKGKGGKKGGCKHGNNHVIKCYKCGKPGHKADACRANGNNHVIKCYKCGKPGHKADVCRSKGTGRQQSS